MPMTAQTMWDNMTPEEKKRRTDAMAAGRRKASRRRKGGKGRISKTRSIAMQKSWKRRKDEAVNGQSISIGNVITALKLAQQLVETCDGNLQVALALVTQAGGKGE